MLWSVFKWLGDLLKNLFNALMDLLISFFEVIYDLIRGLLYLLYMIGVLAAKLFFVLLKLGQLAYSMVVGFLRTIGNMVYTPGGSTHHALSGMVGKTIKPALDALHMDIVAYILLVVIWILTSLGVFKLIGSIRNA